MKLYIGGAFQGQRELAEAENPGAEIFPDFHETIRQAVNAGQDPRDLACSFCAEHPDAVVVSNEVGCGIVPMLAQDRAFREAVGRAMCIIARQSDQVTRVVCGIGVKIK